MFLLYTGGSGSPIAARQTAPILLILIILALICAVITLTAFIFKKYTDYIKSDEYLEKQKNRPTKRSDVLKIAEDCALSKTDISILWEVSQITNCNNIYYLLKSNAEVNELFRNAYNLMKAQELFNDIKMNNFFECLFKLESYVAQIKKIFSTTQIPVQSMIFYISDEGEQYPFTVTKNTKDFFVTEIPEFLLKSPQRPNILVRSRFTFKTVDGLSYNFVSRIIRYEDTPGGEHCIIVAHTDQLQCQAQRHYKREFFQEKCHFSSIQVNEGAKSNSEKYVISEKKYDGKISNISAGGCCIQTVLPVKEKQHICVYLPSMGITENIIGIIRSTRKLPTGVFALHIQFLDISINSKNKIYSLVYKYEL